MELISKRAVDKAGDILKKSLTDNITTDELNDALEVLNVWRSRHIIPMNRAYMLVKKYSDKIGNHAVFGQRLKRTPSIIYKLNRISSNLSQLQDIGGCRVILSDITKVNQLYKALKKSKLILPREKNYLTKPKADGYRGIHLIYRSQSKNILYDKLNIEIQIRTRLQHAWATAVEIIDTFSGERLKIGKGSYDWQRLFYLIANQFAKNENIVYDPDSDDLVELTQLATKLNIIGKLMSFSHISKGMEQKAINYNNYLVLWLNVKDKRANIIPVEYEDEASRLYLSLEQSTKNTDDEVVLIRSDSIKQLYKSYPNYFADSRLFIEKLVIFTKISANPIIIK